MTAIYLPDHDAIYAAIPLYQRWENDVLTESPGYHVSLKAYTFEPKPLAYCISNQKEAFVISQEHYLRLVKKRLVIELGGM